MKNQNFISEDFKSGTKFKIGRFCIIEKNCIVGNNVELGDYVKLMPGTVIGDNCKLDDYVNTSGYVKIGNNVRIKRCSMIGQATEIEDDVWIGSCIKTTRIKYPSIISEKNQKEEWIHIKKGSMIGSDVLILAGVTIGEGAVIGAGAIISKDCEPYGVYRNEGAKLVRYRNKEQIKAIKKS